MFDILRQKRRKNIATPSGYIFVFVDEVLNKTILIFPSLRRVTPQTTHYAPIYPLDIFPHLSPPIVAQARRGYSM